MEITPINKNSAAFFMLKTMLTVLQFQVERLFVLFQNLSSFLILPVHHILRKPVSA